MGIRDDQLDATVIIPAYKRPDRLRRAIRSVLSQDMDPARYELIVVDSTPGDANRWIEDDLRAEARCSFRFLHKDPEGPGPSRNLGAREARGRILAFTDSDCVVSPSWLRAGVAAFENPAAGVAQGRTIPETGVPHNAMCAYVWVEAENFIYETANIFYRREAFERAGGFPTASDLDRLSERPVGGEDVTLAWRVKRAGWESVFAPEALVMHEVVPLSLARWMYEKRLFIFPRLVRDLPELRRFFFLGHFYDRQQALLSIAIPGVLFGAIFPWALLLVLPYVLTRLLEPTNSLGGPLRPARLALYAGRDVTTFAVLAWGSLRHRSVLL